MPRRGRRMGSDATALQEPPETLSTGAAKTMPERRSGSVTVETTVTVGPTESEIATVAYQLWLDNGCPVGSHQEDWLRAEATLKNALAAKRQDLSRRPSIPRRDTCTDSEMTVEFRWEGHWEIWEMEWGGTRWIWD